MQDSKGHVLLADDDVNFRVTLAESLRAKGYEVKECRDGLEAYDWLLGNRTDFLITGIRMPNLGGFELLLRLKQVPSFQGTPFYIFSHKGDPGDRRRAKELGARDFFVYGFITPNEVDAVLQQVQTNKNNKLVGKS